MQTRASNRTVAGLLLALVASLLYVPAAEALPLVAPSTVWGHTYAGEASLVQSVPTKRNGQRIKYRTQLIYGLQILIQLFRLMLKQPGADQLLPIS